MFTRFGFIFLVLAAVLIGLISVIIFIDNVNFRGTSERPFKSISDWEYAVVSGWVIGNGEVLEKGTIIYYIDADSKGIDVTDLIIFFNKRWENKEN